MFCSLIQTIGRCARNVNARVLLYGDRVSDAMQKAIDETERRRVVQEAYNVMFMAAKATMNHLGANATSHRAVASIYRKELIGRKLLDRKYTEHLRKIYNYREQVMSKEQPDLEPELVEKIIEVCKDFVKIMNDIINKHPEPIIDYDISDFA